MHFQLLLGQIQCRSILSMNWSRWWALRFEWTLTHIVVLSTIVTMLYVWETLIPCPTMLVVVHAKQLYYQAIYNFCLSVCLWMEGYRQRKSRVELLPKNLPKCADKYNIFVKNNGCRDAIVFPHMFKEELSNLLCCCGLLTWYEYSHLGKSVLLLVSRHADVF